MFGYGYGGYGGFGGYGGYGGWYWKEKLNNFLPVSLAWLCSIVKF